MNVLICKQFKHWLENKRTKEIIQAFTSFINPTHVSDANVVTVENTWLNRSAHIRAERSLNANFQLIYQVFGGVNGTQQIVIGTYLHPDLIPHLACWVSNEFAWKVSKIVNVYMVREVKMKIEEQQSSIQKLELGVTCCP